MTKKAFAGAVAALGVCACALAQAPVAEPAGMPPEGGRGWERRGGLFRDEAGPAGGGQGLEMIMEFVQNNPEVLREARVTDDQMAALKAAMDQGRKESLPLRTELEKLALEQAKMLMESTVNEEELMKLVEKTGAVRSEIAKIRMKGLLLVKRTLTAEQIDDLKQSVRQHAREQFTRRMEERRGARGDGPGHRRGGPDEGRPRRPDGAGAPPPPPPGAAAP